MNCCVLNIIVIFVLWEMDINNDIDKAISEVINYINKVQQNPVTTTV